jgi:hypothetical protein
MYHLHPLAKGMLKKTACGFPTNIGPTVISRPTSLATRYPLIVDKFRAGLLLLACFKGILF